MQEAPPPSPLHFDRAETSESEAALTCTACQAPAESTYFMKGPSLVCAECAPKLAAAAPPGSRAGRFFRALAFGSLGGIAGSAVYGGLLLATKGTEFGIVSILVGYLVGRGVHKGSYGVGGRGYQVLALALTYVAIAFSYAPMVFQGITEGESVAGLQRVLVMIFALVFSLAVPFLSLTQGASAILGVIILGIGLHQAWRLNRREEVALLGPFDVPTREPAPIAPVAETDAAPELPFSDASEPDAAQSTSVEETPPAPALPLSDASEP